MTINAILSKTNYFLKAFSLAFISLLLFNCGGGSDQNESEENESNEEKEEGISININDENVNVSSLKDALENMEKTLSESADEEKVEVVDFRKLKDMLPETLIGLKRVSHSGEKGGAFGFKVSKADAKYENDEQQLEIEITDTGGFGLAKMGLAAFNAVEIDKESDHGYEKTYNEEGIKYYEEYDNRYKSGSLKAFINERFLVNMEGDGIEMKDFKSAIKKLNLKQLLNI